MAEGRSVPDSGSEMELRTPRSIAAPVNPGNRPESVAASKLW